MGPGEDRRQANPVLWIRPQIEEKELRAVILERGCRVPEEGRRDGVGLQTQLNPDLGHVHQAGHLRPKLLVVGDQGSPHRPPLPLTFHVHLDSLHWLLHRMSLNRLIKEPVFVPLVEPAPAPET